ncbi:MAG: N-acetylmuramic acid 6-phosphate etherase, partial [Selenomonadaceae bacterium]|nr:N-acetylmuramic acid 6-phosphate etherase [Selenomonadaceae bacterium]
AATIALSCVENSEIAKIADIAITPVTGAEVITGSTRLKAGTATKLVLNMLTNATMIKMGKVYGNLMVDVQATNDKLRDRAIRIVKTATGCTEETATEALQKSNGSAKSAIHLIVNE